MSIRWIFILIFIFSISLTTFSQYRAPLYLKATERTERDKMHVRILENIILKNLQKSLSDDTEENWQSAFQAMEVVDFKNDFTWQKMQEALSSALFQSVDFQRHVLETAFALYPDQFIHEVTAIMRNTQDPKIFAMCGVYLLKSKQDPQFILQTLDRSFSDSMKDNLILLMLKNELKQTENQKDAKEFLPSLLSPSFLPSQIVMFSFQRKNRDYPGLVMVRNRNGTFVKDTSGNYFSVPQLARGIANLPFFLTKGNTPQGIYKMFGFGVSGSQFIGPTANVQMGMPVEISKSKFLGTSQPGDSDWKIEDYASLIPASLKSFQPLYEVWYAGLAGRNAIISHGTTIDPELYKGKPYYPMTPTEGCLCTKEFWDGKLTYSDQQRLVSALLKAGGAHGYVVVIELDDEQRPVNTEDLLPFLNKF